MTLTRSLWAGQCHPHLPTQASPCPGHRGLGAPGAPSAAPAVAAPPVCLAAFPGQAGLGTPAPGLGQGGGGVRQRANTSMACARQSWHVNNPPWWSRDGFPARTQHTLLYVSLVRRFYCCYEHGFIAVCESGYETLFRGGGSPCSARSPPRSSAALWADLAGLPCTLMASSLPSHCCSVVLGLLAALMAQTP